MKKLFLLGMLFTLTFVYLTGFTGKSAIGHSSLPSKKERLRVATTTSLYDTGFWNYLEPIFEKMFDVELGVIYAGTGIAFEYGKRGDVDALVIHDRVREDEFMSQGYGVNRRCFAYNYFIIVGPKSDPAGIEDMSPIAAFKKLMREGRKNPDKVKFISRGDNSGTHAKEKQIWGKAGYEYDTVQKSGPWYIEAGKGMGPTLLMANEIMAYTLVDTGTFLAYKGNLKLIPLVQKGRELLNVYGVMAVNPERYPHVNIKMANNLINFFISDEGQKLIGEYGVEKYRAQLFIPCGGGKCKEIGCPTWKECSKPVRWPVK